MSTSGRYRKYIRGCSVHRRDIMMYVEGYHEYMYIGGCSVHRRDSMMHVGDIIIHVGGYQEYMGDVQYIGVFNINQRLLLTFSPT